MAPLAPPLERYHGCPARVSAVMLSDWELYAVCQGSIAKWNVKNAALIWLKPLAGRPGEMLDISHLVPGRLLVKHRSSIGCYSTRSGRKVWETEPVQAAGSWDEFRYEEEDDEEIVDDTVCGQHANLQQWCLDTCHKRLWATYNNGCLAVDLRTGKFLSPTFPKAPPLAQRRATYKAHLTAAVKPGPPSAELEWCMPPSWTSDSGKPMPALWVPRFDEVQRMYSVGDAWGGRLPQGLPALVAWGESGGVYAWDAKGATMWQFYMARKGASMPESAGAGDMDEEMDPLLAVAFDVEHKLLICADMGERVFALDLESGQCKWSWDAKPTTGSASPLHLVLDRHRGLVYFLADSGHLVVLKPLTGEVVANLEGSMFNAYLQSAHVVVHPPGKQLALPSQAALPSGDSTEDGPAWSSEAPQNAHHLATVIAGNHFESSVVAIEVLASTDAPKPKQAGTGGAAAGETAVQISNPIGSSGSTTRRDGAVWAVPVWRGKGRNAEYGSEAVCAVHDPGFLVVGKEKGDMEAWNITAGGNPQRWAVTAGDYIWHAAPWHRGESSAADKERRKSMVAAMQTSKEKGKSKNLELDEVNVDHAILAPGGIMVTASPDGQLRGWERATGQLQWVAKLDTRAKYAEEVEHMAILGEGRAARLLCLVNMNEVLTLSALLPSTGEVLWRRALVPKVKYELSVLGLAVCPSRGLAIALAKPYMPDPEDDDCAAYRLPPAAKAEAKLDYDNPPLVMTAVAVAEGAGGAAAGGAGPPIVWHRVLRRHAMDERKFHVVDSMGRLIVCGDTRITCIQVETGAKVWSTPLPTEGSLSKFQVSPDAGRILLMGWAPSGRGMRLLSMDMGSGSVKARRELPTGAKFEMAASGALVAVSDPRTGVSLFSASDLALRTQHPFAFTGVPSRLVFMETPTAGGCCGCCRPGNAGLAGSASSVTAPSHLVVLGTGGEVMPVYLQEFLGPLRISSQTEWGEAQEAKGIKRFAAIHGPRVAAYLSAIGMLVNFVQMIGFAFQSAVPTEMEDSAETIDSVQAVGVDFFDFLALFFSVIALVAVFLLMLMCSERVEAWFFLNSGKPLPLLTWKAMSTLASLMTGTLLIPVMRTLAAAVDCTDVGGKLVWDAHGNGSVECFVGSHLVYVVLAGIALALYMPVVVRLLRVDSDLAGLEIDLARPWDWTGDDQSELALEHFLSPKRSYYPVVQAVAKALASIVFTLFGQQRPLLASGTVIVLGLVLMAVGVLSPPFHYAGATQLGTALDAGITWTYVTSFVATYVITNAGGASEVDSTTSLILTITPGGILLVLPLALALQAWWGKALCGALCPCVSSLPQYEDKAGPPPPPPPVQVSNPIADTGSGPAPTSSSSPGLPINSLPLAAATERFDEVDEAALAAILQKGHESADEASDSDSGSKASSADDDDDDDDDDEW